MNKTTAIHTIISATADQPVVFTTGYSCRIAKHLADRPNHFYMTGSMGLAASIATGFAMATGLAAVDGDGSLLMNPTCLVTAGTLPHLPLIHVVLDDASYASTGGQRTPSPKTDFTDWAQACGYPDTFRISDQEHFFQVLARALRRPSPTLIHCVLTEIDDAVPPRGRASDLHLGGVQPQLDTLGLGVGEHVLQRSKPHARPVGNSKAPLRQQSAHLTDGPGDSRAIGTEQYCQHSVRQIVSQMNQRGQQPLHKHQPIAGTGTLRTSPHTASLLETPSLHRGCPRAGQLLNQRRKMSHRDAREQRMRQHRPIDHARHHESMPTRYRAPTRKKTSTGCAAGQRPWLMGPTPAEPCAQAEIVPGGSSHEVRKTPPPLRVLDAGSSCLCSRMPPSAAR